MLRAVLWTLSIALPTSLMASGEHGDGEIINDDLNLTYVDHVLEGHIGEHSIKAEPLEEEFGIRLWHTAASGVAVESVFKKSGEQLIGSVMGLNPSGEEIATDFVVTKIDHEGGKITGTIGDQAFSVQISAEKMDGHHYVNPHFVVRFSDHEPYSFDLINSSACMGCAVKISYVIVSQLYLQRLL